MPSADLVHLQAVATSLWLASGGWLVPCAIGFMIAIEYSLVSFQQSYRWFKERDRYFREGSRDGEGREAWEEVAKATLKSRNIAVFCFLLFNHAWLQSFSLHPRFSWRGRISASSQFLRQKPQNSCWSLHTHTSVLIVPQRNVYAAISTLDC